MQRACVIGWPAAHSRSPDIHGYWLERHGLDGAYTRESVAPEDLPAFIRDLGKHGYAGANVTLPHKEQALHLADEVDADAAAIGAANTLWFERDRLHAGNTDAYGFMTALREGAPSLALHDRPVLVLGAGGAARAILFGLLTSGAAEIRLVNRTRARAEALAHRFDPRVRVHDWSERNEMVSGCGLVVNTTTLGMAGGPPLEFAIDGLPGVAAVMDIVYVPLETPLLAAARGRGLVGIDGLGMLLHQAVPGFERWFGVRPEVTADLRRRIEASLASQKC